jgi:hypothetical protein
VRHHVDVRAFVGQLLSRRTYIEPTRSGISGIDILDYKRDLRFQQVSPYPFKFR